MKILSTAPTRISYFGGGTDLPVYYLRYGGLVISTSINIRQKIVLSDAKTTKVNTMPKGASERFYKEIISEFNGKYEVEASFDTTIESGLGSSASAAVALVGALNKAENFGLNSRMVAEKAWDLEVNKIGLYGGKQDQYAAIFGGANAIWFNPDGTVFSRQLDRKVSEFLHRHTILFNTNLVREKKKIQENLLLLSDQQKFSLDELKSIAKNARWSIMNRSVEEVGRYLRDAWTMKKKSNKDVTKNEIDLLYDTGINSGALGGKLMGSGGGGCMFFWCYPQDRPVIRMAMESLGCTHLDFGIDYNGLEVREI